MASDNYSSPKAYAQGVPHPVGVIVCKQSPHRERYLRGYIAMLSVDKGYRKRGIGTSLFSPLSSSLPFLIISTMTASTLVRHSISVMQASGAREVSHIPRNTLLPHRPNPILLLVQLPKRVSSL